MKKRRIMIFLLMVCCLLGLSIRTAASAGMQKEVMEKKTIASEEGVVKEVIAEPTMIPEQTADKEQANRTSGEMERLEVKKICLGKISEEEYPMKVVEAVLDSSEWSDEVAKERMRNKLLEIIKQMEE
ncbi:MAG: hypothetical protein IKL28_03635 [Lachnospiraceae bacterium]|nr:hypothetical protein [Lachnospiraceae bacterium]